MEDTTDLSYGWSELMALLLLTISISLDMTHYNTTLESTKDICGRNGGQFNSKVVN